MNDPILYADFNDTDENQNVIALRSRENKRVVVERGDPVELRDEDGFRVGGLVRRVTAKTVVVSPNWATWRNPSAFRITKRAEPGRDDLVVTLMNELPTVGTKSLVG